MRRILVALAVFAASGGAANAQSMLLRGPGWAQLLIASDIAPTTGGRASINEDGVDLGVRVTVAPNQGGVARVIRYEQHGDAGLLALRRFTGHPTTGWWMWGPDTPTVTHPSTAIRTEIATLVRAAMGVSATLGDTTGASDCPNGEQAFVELATGGRPVTATRVCVTANDAVGRLVTRLSEIAGSRNDDELHEAAAAELLGADRAFAAMAQAQGVPAAFAHYAASDAILMGAGDPAVGQDAVTAAYASWPHGARLQWAPVTSRVSERGDMGWTWGRSTYTGTDGIAHAGRYITTWKRDYEGNWRFAFDSALGDSTAAPPARAAVAHPPATPAPPAHAPANSAPVHAAPLPHTPTTH